MKVESYLTTHLKKKTNKFSEFNMEMEKKNIAIIILAVVLAASGIGNVMLALNLGLIELEPEEKKVFVLLTDQGPAVMDPVDTWDYNSFDVQLQVLEGLVTYNLSNHPTYEIIPALATSWGWNAAKDSIWFDLRRGVTFHDGSPFDASVVKWNFDRLMFFINWTGDLVANSTTWAAFPASLYFDSSGKNPIINSTVVNSQYNVTVNLNFPFVMFLDLITFEATTILSPASTKFYSYLDLTTDLLVGTGPFVYDSYTTDVEVRMHRWEDYWGPLPYFEEVVFSIISDGTARNIAGLAREGDYVMGVSPEMLQTFNSSIYHTVFSLGDSLVYRYVEFNCEKLNVTWRKALSLAINYTYIIEEIAYPSVRGPPAVPVNMPGHNASVVLADFDITAARIAMQSMGFGVGLNTTFPGTDDAAWSAATFASDALGGPIDMNRFSWSTSNLRINQLMALNFDWIGVDTDETIREWGEYLDVGENSPGDMDLSVIGWGPDYLDAFNMLDPLFNNASASNFAQLNDPVVLGWLADAAIEQDAPTRQLIYMKIQSYLFDITRPDRFGAYPHAPIHTGTTIVTHDASLKGVAYNAMERFWIYPMYKGNESVV